MPGHPRASSLRFREVGIDEGDRVSRLEPYGFDVDGFGQRIARGQSLRLVEQVSLAVLNAHFGDDVPNRLAIDALGDDFAAKFLSGLDDSSNDTLFFRTFIEVFNEARTVDLNYVRPPVLFESGEVRSLRTEVVESDFASGLF